MINRLNSGHKDRGFQGRRAGGNMLALVAAFCFIIIVILLFALGYVRLLGGSSEQKTAIEAAALAAARDCSTIVINTPEFGFVGLSDSAPNGTGTTATDTFYTPVTSINTLIGTARLDYIIADQLNVSEMEELALRDLTAAKTRANNLVAALDNAITPSGSGQDKDGNTVTPYVSAENAYTQNQVRMTGTSNYVAGSMQLALGGLQGGASTNVPVPKPAGVDTSLDNTNTVNGFYKSYTNVPYDGQNFVFAAIGDSVRLVDPNLWRATLALPYYHRTVVRAQASTTLSDPTSSNHTLQAVACAQPASVYDPKPAPGALQISFPDGMPTGPEDVNRPRDLYAAPIDDPAKTTDYFRGNNGDYPVSIGSNISIDTTTWPVSSDTSQKDSTACKIAVYDWLRRAGTKANVVSVIGMHNTPFDPQGGDVPWGSPSVGNIPRGITHIYRFDPDGIVSYESKELKPNPYYVVSENQVYMEAFDVMSDAVNWFEINGLALGAPINAAADGVIEFESAYDMFIRIYTHRPGTTNGGRHAGEPMDNLLVATRPANVKLSPFSNSGSASVDSMVVSGKGAWMNQYGKNKKSKTKSGGVPIGTTTIGVPPTVIGRTDFMQTVPGTIDRGPSWYEKFDATGGGIRVTYQQNGTVADIRFRRILSCYSAASDTIIESGYVGFK